MATNQVYRPGENLSLVVSHPTTPASGDPVRYGTITGIAITDEGDGGNAATATSVAFGGVWDIVVDDNGGSGIAVGAKLYYHDTGTGSPSTSVNNSSASADAFFGYALEAISANGTDRIRVLHSVEQV